MPPAPAPTKPGGGLDLKKLPPWAWVVAIAGGAVVGFVLLKPGSQDADEELDEAASEEAPAGRGGGGGGGAPPIPREALEALGLSPGEYQYASYGDSGSGESSGDGVGGDGAQTLQSQSYVQSLLAGAPTSSQGYGYASSLPQGSSTPLSSGYTNLPTPSAPAPAAPSGSSGNQANVPQ